MLEIVVNSDLILELSFKVGIERVFLHIHDPTIDDDNET